MKSLTRILVLAVVVFLGWRFYLEPNRIRSAIAASLGAEDVSPFQIISLESRPAFELTTLIKPILVQYMATKGSGVLQSSLTLQGAYDVKIGFDLLEYSKISVDRFTLHATVELPNPKVTSVESTGYQVMGSDQMLWTSFSPEEQLQAINGMNSVAENAAATESNFSAAIGSAGDRLREIAQTYGSTIEVVSGKQRIFWNHGSNQIAGR